MSSGDLHYATLTTANTTGEVTWTYEYNTYPPMTPVGDLIIRPKEENKIEGVEIMKLYEVWMVYAEDIKNPFIFYSRIIARNPEDAKLKNIFAKDIKEEWDIDYLTIIVREIGDVKVKEKPKEVKNI